MVDIHNHILSGMDDGAKDEECTLQMGKIAQKGRIKKIIATPHFSYKYEGNTKSRILDRVAKTNALFKENNIKVEIYSGAEVLLSNNLGERAEKGELPTLNHSRYILIELPRHTVPGYTFEVLFQLGLHQMTPIIAHVEQNLGIVEQPMYAERLRDAGCFLQVNAASIMLAWCQGYVLPILVSMSYVWM